jgi:hypothetical protein
MTLLAAEVQRYVHGEYMDGLLVVSTMLRSVKHVYAGAAGPVAG